MTAAQQTAETEAETLDPVVLPGNETPLKFTSTSPLELFLTAWSVQRERGDSVADYAQNALEAEQILRREALVGAS